MKIGMKAALLALSAMLVQPSAAFAAEKINAPHVITSPDAIPEGTAKPRIFLGGSIDMGRAEDWQAALPQALAHLDVLWLNPRRADWDPNWKPEADEPEFRRQVEWELAALEASDIIILYFAAGSQSPISLLELGLHARSGKVIALAPEGFWRKGNVDITAEQYDIEQVSDMPTLQAAIRRRVEALRAAPQMKKPKKARGFKVGPRPEMW